MYNFAWRRCSLSCLFNFNANSKTNGNAACNCGGVAITNMYSLPILLHNTIMPKLFVYQVVNAFKTDDLHDAEGVPVPWHEHQNSNSNLYST